MTDLLDTARRLSDAADSATKSVAWRLEDHCHPGWFYYGNIADEPPPLNATLLYDHTPVPDMAATIRELADEVERMRKAVRVANKVAAKAYSRVAAVVMGIEDAGDRVSFGSTNDADILRDLKEEWDAHRIAGETILTSEQEVAVWKARAKKSEAEAERLRTAQVAMVAAAQPFADMSAEMFARNWNKDGVAISLVGKSGPMRLTFAHFLDIHTALRAIKGETE